MIIVLIVDLFKMPKEKYEKYQSPNPRRTHTFMSPEDLAAGKKSSWYELEITGKFKNIYLEIGCFEVDFWRYGFKVQTSVVSNR